MSSAFEKLLVTISSAVALGLIAACLHANPLDAAEDAPGKAASDAVTDGGNAGLRVWKLSGAVDSLAWSPDGAMLAIQTKPGEGATDRMHRIEIWNVSEARMDRVLHETDEPIFSVAFSPDGKSLACAAWRRANPLLRLIKQADRTFTSEARLWDVATGKLTRTFEIATKDELGLPANSDLLAIRFSPDGRLLAGCGKLTSQGPDYFGQHLGGEVCVWDVETGQLKWRDRTTHTDIVYDVVFTPDGKSLVSGGIDKLVRLFDPQTGDVQKTLSGVAWDGMASLSLSRDGVLLASGGIGREEGRLVRIWDRASGRLLRSFDGFKEHSTIHVAFSPTADRLFAIGGAEADEPRWQMRAWNVHSGQFEGVIVARPGHARAIGISPDGKLAAVGTYQRELVLCDVSAD
jgi:WD40 repeat protein